MTTIEKIQLTVNREFGADVAMAVHMALARYVPTKIAIEQYGTRACNVLENIRQEEEEEALRLLEFNPLTL